MRWDERVERVALGLLPALVVLLTLAVFVALMVHSWELAAKLLAAGDVEGETHVLAALCVVGVSIGVVLVVLASEVLVERATEKAKPAARRRVERESEEEVRR